jgi:ribosomal protein S27AE
MSKIVEMRLKCGKIYYITRQNKDGGSIIQLHNKVCPICSETKTYGVVDMVPYANPELPNDFFNRKYKKMRKRRVTKLEGQSGFHLDDRNDFFTEL